MYNSLYMSLFKLSCSIFWALTFSTQVNRSTALLKSLSAERDRWEKTSETFKNQMSTIAGDCLLSAAFITYAGYFEQQMRQNLFTTWSHHLQQANIQVGKVLIHKVVLIVTSVNPGLNHITSLFVETFKTYLKTRTSYLPHTQPHSPIDFTSEEM